MMPLHLIFILEIDRLRLLFSTHAFASFLVIFVWISTIIPLKTEPLPSSFSSSQVSPYALETISSNFPFQTLD
jgi:hypothetical protein